jgi:hypothetical protein
LVLSRLSFCLSGLEREAKLADLAAKQLNLDARGVTAAALHAIATHSALVEGNVADHAAVRQNNNFIFFFFFFFSHI